MKVLCKEGHQGEAPKLIQVLILLQEQSVSPAWASHSSCYEYRWLISQHYFTCHQSGCGGTRSDVKVEIPLMK